MLITVNQPGEKIGKTVVKYLIGRLTVKKKMLRIS